MKWLTTIEVLTAEGKTVQHRVLPLDLDQVGQCNTLLLTFQKVFDDVWLSLPKAEREIRMRIWVRPETVEPPAIITPAAQPTAPLIPEGGVQVSRRKAKKASQPTPSSSDVSARTR